METTGKGIAGSGRARLGSKAGRSLRGQSRGQGRPGRRPRPSRAQAPEPRGLGVLSYTSQKVLEGVGDLTPVFGRLLLLSLMERGDGGLHGVWNQIWGVWRHRHWTG